MTRWQLWHFFAVIHPGSWSRGFSGGRCPGLLRHPASRLSCGSSNINQQPTKTDQTNMEDKRKRRSPKVSLPQPPPPPINPRKLPPLPASKSATFSLGLPQPPSPKNRGKYKRSIGAPGQPREVLATVAAPPKVTRWVRTAFMVKRSAVAGLLQALCGPKGVMCQISCDR